MAGTGTQQNLVECGKGNDPHFFCTPHRECFHQTHPVTAALNLAGQVPFAICRIPSVCEQQWRDPNSNVSHLSLVLGAATRDFIFPVNHKICDLPSERPSVLSQLQFVF